MTNRKSTPFGRAIDRARNNPTSRVAIEELSRFVTAYRFHLGCNYQQTFNIAHKLTDIDSTEWDSLLYEMDSIGV